MEVEKFIKEVRGFTEEVSGFLDFLKQEFPEITIKRPQLAHQLSPILIYFTLEKDKICLKMSINHSLPKEKIREEIQFLYKIISEKKKEIMKFLNEIQGYPFSFFYFFDRDGTFSSRKNILINEKFTSYTNKIIKFYKAIKRLFGILPQVGIQIVPFEIFHRNPFVHDPSQYLMLPLCLPISKIFLESKDLKEFNRRIKKIIKERIEKWYISTKMG